MSEVTTEYFSESVEMSNQNLLTGVKITTYNAKEDSDISLTFTGENEYIIHAELEDAIDFFSAILEELEASL